MPVFGPRRWRRLSILAYALLCGPGVGSAFGAQALLAPQLPSLVTDGALIFRNPVYQPLNRPPFGNACRICPQDVVQGALNDCALLSALAAVANASPGTIEKALLDTSQQDPAGDEIYQASYWNTDQGAWTTALITSSFPAQNVSVWDKWAANITNLRAPGTPFFIYAQLPPSGSTWPMLMEKGYVAMSWASGGYATPDLMEYANLQTRTQGIGLDPAIVLTRLTGYATTAHDVKSPTAIKQIASVWIRDSPPMTDTGGNGILAGLLLHHDFKAVEPNLKACLSPIGQEHARPLCTAACRESHTCRQTVPRALSVDPGQKIHVRIVDVDSRSGAEHEVYAFDHSPALCTKDSPCKFDVPASQWVLQGSLVISFDMSDADPLQALDTLLSRLQREHSAVIVGSRTKAQCPADDPVCTQLFGAPLWLVEGHAYYLERYVQSSRGTIGNNQVVIGDPHGGELVERTLTLTQFYHSFLKVYQNPTAHEPSRCNCTR